MPTIGSLFTGIGGIDLGFQQAGFTIEWQVEIDPFCNHILEKRWPNTLRIKDIRQAINLKPVNCLVGGFPCQDVSTAGKRLGLSGNRTSLWSEMARIISELRPKCIFIENVSTIRNKDTDVFEKVLWDLAALRYDAEWHCVSASYLSAPHTRDRIWIVATDTLRCLCSTKQECQCTKMGWLQFALANGKIWEMARQLCGSWGIESTIPRAIDGLSVELDRFKVLGNAVIPAIPFVFAKVINEHFTQCSLTT
jgi:DNA (cytosine-5)-methyltransferase 1